MQNSDYKTNLVLCRVVVVIFLRHQLCSAAVSFVTNPLLETFSVRGIARLRAYGLSLSLLAYYQKIDTPKCFIAPFFTRKVGIVIFILGG